MLLFLLGLLTFVFGTLAFTLTSISSLNVYSAGLLVGTALIVIIPEGLDLAHVPPNIMGLYIALGFAVMFLVEDGEDTALLGFLIHSCSDGLALGASMARGFCS
jgi:hypothetical protein